MLSKVFMESFKADCCFKNIGLANHHLVAKKDIKFSNKKVDAVNLTEWIFFRWDIFPSATTETYETIEHSEQNTIKL